MTSSSKPTPSPPLSTTTKPTNQSPPDAWTDTATSTLINAWGCQFLELNRGKLTHTHWLSVVDSVNSTHSTLSPKTLIQCQNRIDTLKKRFKSIKSSLTDDGSKPTWTHFKVLDYLIGGNTRKKPRRFRSESPESSPERSSEREVSPEKVPERRVAVLGWKVPVGPRTKRKLAVVVGGEEEGGRKERRGGGGDGIRVLAEAIERLGRVYERVEMEKIRQMMELEKQRMLFCRDLELFRMKFFMETRRV